ncbi:MAG TPA: DUF3866 family protein [Solirubrobacterales bacterium]|nr:DUF3866 family protein [Solirubrobacterales bacterium]
MAGRLKLRRGVIASADPLEVELAGERRRAWADEDLLGEMREGDEVVVNVAALDLGLGSGGFDVVHANLTRGLEGDGVGGEAHVMKLNYTSIQHPVEPVERTDSRGEGVPVAILPLHGHLAPAAWALAQVAPGLRVGYVQTGGGALPGSLSRDVRELRERGLLAGHVTAAPSYGGEYEALSTVGALDAASKLGWDAVLVGPGPGIIGSATEFGHGGMVALDTAHAALAVGAPTLVSPRLSGGDPRERHRGLSHHTRTVLELLLSPVDVPIPENQPEIAALIEHSQHRVQQVPADLDGYAATNLPTMTMGRSLQGDPLFFAAPLAAGTYLARVAS